MEAKQTPLIELLERIPQDARLVVEHDQFSSSVHPVGKLCREAAAALRAALEQPEQEPIGWLYPEGMAALKAGKCWTAYGTKQDDNNIPIYDAVAPRAEPRASESGAGFESLPASLEPEQEPVAWMLKSGHGTEFNDCIAEELKALTWKGKPMWTPLYTAPAKRKPLTNEQQIKVARLFSDYAAKTCNVNADDFWKHQSSDILADVQFVLKAAHDIKEGTYE